ncbi:MAG: hypothetical protein ACI9ON_001598 [Limisphaerales bacterium]|jgi:hypothetical protein
MSDYDNQQETEDLYELMEDDFNPERFYTALSNALQQLENYNEQAA